MMLTAAFGKRLPKNSITAAPKSGTKGISQIRSKKFINFP
jgi:hypothetical protein